MKATLRKTETRKILLFGLFVALVFAMLSLDSRAETEQNRAEASSAQASSQSSLPASR